MRPILVALCISFALALPAAAQVTFDNVSTASATPSIAANSVTFAHTTTTDPNRILLVSVHVNIRSSPLANATSVTYGGQTLTRLAFRNHVGGATRTEVWYLLNPPTGTHNVVTTIGGIAGGDIAVVVGAETFSNALQLAPTFVTSSGTGNPATATIAAAANDLIVDFITGRETVNVSPNAPQATIFDVSTGAGANEIEAGSSSRLAATPATTMSWNVSAGREWSLIAVNLKEAVADVGITKTTSDPPGDDGVWGEGDALSYILTVTNNGPSAAANVVVTDPLPAGYSFVSVTPGAPTCTESGGTVTCTFASMASGASHTITINGTITTNTTQLVNTASVTHDETDLNAANDSASVTTSVRAPNFVEMLEMSAVQDANGKVLLTWTTSFETDNLGFNVYRQTASGREQLNRQLIAGSALFTARQQLGSGRGYRWKDKVRGGEHAQYFIEDVDLDGTRTMHGPVTPSLVHDVPEAANTDTLSDLGSNGGIFVSPRGLGAARLPNAQATQKQREQQWALASQPSIKLMVTQEGWYRVTKSALAAAGFVAGNKVALFTNGIEQPITVTDDAIEFYGLGNDTPASGARAYWLTNDKGAGFRIKREKAAKGTQPLARTAFTFERIERTLFFAALTNNGERENFYGAIVTGGGATQELTVENLDRSGGAASLELVLQGATGGRHDVRLAINGADAGNVAFRDMQRKVGAIAVPLSLLRDGTNTLSLTALAGDMDVSVVESLRLTYPHRLIADDDALKVSASGGSAISISGFKSARVRAIDVTDPAAPIELAVTVTNGTASLVAPGSGARSIVVIGDARVLAPAQLVASRASRWNDTTNAADLVIISARAFMSAAAPLQALREREGLRTLIVDVQDLYDEFSFGERSPHAIREFLQRARSWQRAPKYVLFLGDASADPRNYYGAGTFDFVPTKLVPTFYMKAASDEWFAPDLAIGRLPARTVAEAETMIAKIVARETAGNERIAFVTDHDEDGFDFAAAARSLGTLAPSASPKTFAQSANAAAFDSLLLTYLGHGSTDYWRAGAFTGEAASSLTNAKLPIVAAMSCLNGYFHDPFMPSVAESLLTNANGGAVAVWASSTMTQPEPQLDATRELFRHLFAGARLGDAIRQAKRATTDDDVRRSWILFGDPTMTLLDH